MRYQTGRADIKGFSSIAENLSAEELESLGRIVNAYLELAEDRAKRHIPMTMEDWATRLDKFLEFDERQILHNSGSISAKIAKEDAESEFELMVLPLISSPPAPLPTKYGVGPAISISIEPHQDHKL
jgi:hypothetical protein